METDLSVLVDHIDAASLVAAPALAEIRVQRSPDNHIVQPVAVHVADGDRVAKVGPHLGPGEIVQLTHGAAGQEDDLAGQVGPTRHAHRQVGMTVAVKVAQGQGVA